MQEFKIGDPAPTVLKRMTEDEIMSTWKDKADIKVSICCMTYNHEQFIRDALDGFLAQKTDFAFEVLIHDDASLDSTADILREYEHEYPNIIKPIYQTENQHSKGVYVGGYNVMRARGRYLALCEGDDYWIAKTKIQKQYDLMESNTRAVMSVARTAFFQQNANSLSYISTTNDCTQSILSLKEISNYYFHTSTFFIRRDIFTDVTEKYLSEGVIFGDTAVRAILAAYGPFVFLSEIVSVYRRSNTGIWTSLNQIDRVSIDLNIAIKLYEVLSGEHKVLQKKRIILLHRSLIKLYLRSGQMFFSFKHALFFLYYKVSL